MADTIKFRIRTHTVEYGDKRKFVEYRIDFLKGKRIVGCEVGPRREIIDRASARKAARARIAVLKLHRLYAIRITAKHISDGIERNCRACAIAQALWHNQERMGLRQREYNFEVSPYACFMEPRGIVLSKPFYDDDNLALPAEKLPLLVSAVHQERVYPESMVEWAMRFDDWGESRHMTLKEWRKERGYDDDDRPYRPGPAWFVLDLDEFMALSAP
jgi:hypothetical protein